MVPLHRQRFRAIVVLLGLSLVTLLLVGAARSTLGQAATPASTPQVLADSAFPTAEVIHVVSEESDGTVAETWVNQVSGDVVRKITDQQGTLREAQLRQGLTMAYYEVLSGGSSVYIQNEVLSKDDPYLSGATDHLDGLRWALDRGIATRLGEEVFHGHPAIKLQMESDGLGQLIVYADPNTLYPLGHVLPNGTENTVTYRTIETFRLADVPASVFRFTVPPADAREISDRLTNDEIARFTAYPLLNLGPAFGDYTLEVVQHNQASTKEQGNYFDETWSTYRKRDRDGQVIAEIHVKCLRPLTAQDHVDMAKAERDHLIAPATPVTVNGQAARLRPGEGGTWLEIERPNGTIYLVASDRETALAAGASLQPASAAKQLIAPPLTWAPSAP